MKSLGGSEAASRAPSELADIRALERADLPRTAALFERVMDIGIRRPTPVTTDFLMRTLFDTPWTDPDLPSLVAVDKRGRIVGFIGAEVRRMRFGERVIRAVWCQHFVTDPGARHLGGGALLLRRMLRGTQDATFTDNASDVVRQMWVRLGGEVLHLKGIHWVRVFRPWQVAASLAGTPARPRLRDAISRLPRPLDAATDAAAGRFLRPAPVDAASAPLTPRTLLEALPDIAKRLVLHPDYDEPFLEWLFGELVRVERRGRLVAQLVEAPSGQPLGWYMYYLRPGGRSEVLQVAADAGDVGRVLDHLLDHAYVHGSAALRGRLEPGLVEPTVRRRSLLWYRGGALIHSRDPELVRAVHSEKALVTRLEGEWWGDTLI
jgi:hypothetical protein